MQTCWLRLPPFREVATKLRDSLDQAIQVVYLAHNPSARHKSLTSATVKKSNKKRSSAQPVNGLARSTTLGAADLARSAAPASSSPPVPATSRGRLATPAAPSAPSAANRTAIPRRPVARSISLSASTFSPSKIDLLYFEKSPDFCEPNERLDIKGTKGRICSENSKASNSCERLCCGRGYKTEIRLEEYKCECQFKFCCQLDCEKCSRRKIIHKCL